MPKMVRWEKLEGKDIPPTFREAEAVYRDTESIFYLGNFDRSNRSAIEQRWKVMDKEGETLKGRYNCCGFRLNFPPIKWASKVVDNKHEAPNGSDDEESNEEELEDRNYEASVVDDDDDEEPVKAKKKKDRKTAIIEAIQEEAERPSEPPKKRGRGRPKGSRNKPKTGQPLIVKKKRKKRRTA